MRVPKERKLWILRKHVYNGIPPTDPRVLAMTDEQIDLEYAHLELDRKLRDKNKEEFADPEYEQWDEEVNENDAKLSYEYDAANPPAKQAEQNEEDWEDVETDGL